jgi:hypothetical protein
MIGEKRTNKKTANAASKIVIAFSPRVRRLNKKESV